MEGKKQVCITTQQNPEKKQSTLKHLQAPQNSQCPVHIPGQTYKEIIQITFYLSFFHSNNTSPFFNCAVTIDYISTSMPIACVSYAHAPICVVFLILFKLLAEY